MSQREFARWLALYQLERFGEERDDLRIANATAWICAAQGMKVSAEKALLKLDTRSKREKEKELEKQLKSRLARDG